MGILWKLCCRDLLYRKFRLGFTVMAISAVSCLMIWFVGSLDLSVMFKSTAAEKTFGEYSLVLFRASGFSTAELQTWRKNDRVERLDEACQTAPEVILDNVTYESVIYQSWPKITGIARDSAPFEMEQGGWFSKPGECVVSSIAAQALVSGVGHSGKRQVFPGDVLKVKTPTGEVQLTVAGTFQQTVLKVDPNAKKSTRRDTFSYGFGEGIGVGRKPVSSSQTKSGSQKTPEKKEKKDVRRPARGPWSAQGIGLYAPAIYISLEDQKRFSGNESIPNLVFVKLKRGQKAEDFYTDLEKESGSTLEELFIEKTDPETLQSMQVQQADMNALFAQTWSAMGVVIVASVFIIFMTLNMDVSERTRYFGLLRTIGLARWQVAFCVLAEGVLLGISGWFLGMVSGWILLEYLTFCAHGQWIFIPLSGTNILLAFLCTVAATVMASVVPALRASFIRPVESMERGKFRFTVKKLAFAALVGVILLVVMPMIVFLPMDREVRRILFGTVGTLCFGLGFLLFFPWTIFLTEKMGAPILARIFGFHPLFLKNQLVSNQLRTLMTAIILSLGLGLYTALMIWSSSMMYRFLVLEDSIPTALVRVDEMLASEETRIAIQNMLGVNSARFMEVMVAQPMLEETVAKKIEDCGAMSPSVVVLGINPDQAYGTTDPLMKLHFVEGSREEVLKEMSVGDCPRVCVVTSELRDNGGLHIGDFLRLSLPESTQEKPKYAQYRIVGVVDFPGMFWFTKFGNLRISAARCGALAFVPYEVVREDFHSLENEFFWFDSDGKSDHAALKEELQEVIRREMDRVFLPETDEAFYAARYATISYFEVDAEAERREAPEVFVSFHPSVAGKDAARAMRSLESVPADKVWDVSSVHAKLMDGNSAILCGMDPRTAFRVDDPALNFHFSEGSAVEMFQRFSENERSCVILSDFARERGLKLGDQIMFKRPRGTSGRNLQSHEISSATEKLTVAAVVDFSEWRRLAEFLGMSDEENVRTLIFTTLSVTENAFGANTFRNYWCSLPDMERVLRVESEIQAAARKLAEKNREGDALARKKMFQRVRGAQIATIESLNDSLILRSGVILRTMTKMPLIMLVISTIAILNTMIVSVVTRFRELGILRCCGVSCFGLVRMILAESVLIGLCAIIMSFLFGMFYSWLLIHITSTFGIVVPPLVVPWAKIGFGFAVTVFLCILASIYPAFVAGTRKPMELLRERD
ncbi:MAG: ABC transporter permease [Planctomycetia bacterium]|nr:ABC transporter permease [Planctomycetia bacterium]